MRIAVLGTGNIGSTLGQAFAGAGHDVTFGSRTPGAEGTTSFGAAIAGADVVVLAVPGPAVAALVEQHAEALSGRLVVDATNTMGEGPAHSHAAVSRVPSVRYARAFNTLGVENLRQPRFGATQADLLYSAPEADREVLDQLVAATGLRPVYLGDGAHDVLDGVLRLWFTLARRHGRHVGFRVLTD